MHTINLKTPDYDLFFTGPSAWHELSAGQRIALMRLRERLSDAPESIFPALTLLFGMKRRHLRWFFDERWLRYKGFDPEEISLLLQQGQSLLELVSFVMRPDEKAGFLPRFSRYSYRFGTPAVLIGRLFRRQVWCGPAPAMTDATFGELMFADRAYRAADNATLTAILYRPAKNGVRGPFDPDGADKRAAIFRSLDPAIHAAVRHSFESTIAVLARAFPHVFSPAEGEKNQPSAGWLDVALSMAKYDPTRIREYEQTNLYLTLRALDMQLRADQQQQKELEKLRRT
ncbi:hypothetical protein [Arsenicibacter rosenii]|uniref:Uncharacterized protein n=1 Tax=Arsenicibacter rosenii TaxID=1750698 RepID=A0A1S2VNN1_9BACT|nr:hypothetical protein [Arsenicibacter rosenii]OIN59815.1 hypothetical protein BLX24_08125 [Arsenicibacter rosenii]